MYEKIKLLQNSIAFDEWSLSWSCCFSIRPWLSLVYIKTRPYHKKVNGYVYVCMLADSNWNLMWFRVTFTGFPLLVHEAYHEKGISYHPTHVDAPRHYSPRCSRQYRAMLPGYPWANVESHRESSMTGSCSPTSMEQIGPRCCTPFSWGKARCHGRATENNTSSHDTRCKFFIDTTTNDNRIS